MFTKQITYGSHYKSIKAKNKSFIFRNVECVPLKLAQKKPIFKLLCSERL